MDRKRKAPNTTSSSSEPGPPKKIKLLNSNHAPPPSAQSEVQKVGLQLVNNLKKGQDKAGRLIASQFLTLPSREEIPQYYTFTKLPLAIDDIERKLNNNAYATITEVESDFKRLVQNAKDYNNTGSEIFENAERIRKLVYNYMKVHNPAYTKEPGYTSFPTPLPEGAQERTNGARDGHGENGRSETPARLRRTTTVGSSEPQDRKASMTASVTPGATAENENESGVEFEGKTFQQAQQMIIHELLHYTDDEGLEIYTPFANLPSRKLEDYYKVIHHPVSLKGVLKRIRGQHGRNDPTGVSDFKNWDAFEHEVSFIWRNARDYNEDGSDMYLLANDIEEHFKSLLEDAKSKVEGPSQPKLKLGGPKPKVTINLSQQNRPSPAPAPTSNQAPGPVSVDNEALARQRQMVAAGVNGTQIEHRPNSAVNGNVRSTSQVPTAEHPRPGTASSPADGVKLEQVTTKSPAVNAAIPAATTNGSMPPPAVRPPSSSPYPNGQPTASSYTFTAPSLLPPTPLRPYPFSEALMPSITLATHPHLRLSNPLRLTIPPHPTLTQQSRTVTLPPTHYFVQISPTISGSLSSGRQYKMFVTVNGMRLAQKDTFVPQSDARLRTHVYEGTLAQGVNRVEVEVAAAKESGKEGIDVEKVVVYANLTKG